MDKFVIEGGRALKGQVRCAGSKNSVLPILAASLLTDEPLSVPNAPQLADVEAMLDLLRDLGASAVRDSSGGVTAHCASLPNSRASWNQVRRMRGSVAVLGPLLARTGLAVVSQPGGCVIGVRPIDLHLKGMRALGASVRSEHGYIVAEAPKGGLVGASIYLGGSAGSSVLGTGNVIMAATLARGTTVIHGAACEPEVVDLCECLIAMGAKIRGHGSPKIEITGVERLHGTTFRVIPDRIEAGTYLLAGAMTGGAVRVQGCQPDHLAVVLERMLEAGFEHRVGPDWIETLPAKRDRSGAFQVRPTEVTTLTYPGFPTDLQAQWMAAMTQAQGMSLITETIYPDRYMHVAELMRLGANIRRQGTSSIVMGPGVLSGAQVMASDLRASAALVLAGLVAHGTTEVHRVYHIDRGYENIEARLEALGAVIRRTDDPQDNPAEQQLLPAAPDRATLTPPASKPRAARADDSTLRPAALARGRAVTRVRTPRAR